jgi:minor histocompatibility antigen H13
MRARKRLSRAACVGRFSLAASHKLSHRTRQTNERTNTQAEGTQSVEVMQTNDVYMFPVFGSCALFSLYLVYKFCDPYYVNIVVKLYFFLIGLVVLQQKLRQIVALTLPVGVVRALEGPSIVVPVPGFLQEEMGGKTKDTATLTLVDGVGVALSAAVLVWYLLTSHWMASNMLGAAFSLQGIEMLSLGSFRNGAILLTGLFFYDIFWVFGTEVMVTVAKSFDAPIKLLFPRGFDAEGVALKPSMLGLGDIVIPGIFIALLLRFDQRRHAMASTKRVTRSMKAVAAATLDFPATYFNLQIVFYFLGLATTIYVMYAFNAAQPALLYLVPACLGRSNHARIITFLCFSYDQSRSLFSIIIYLHCLC